MDFFKPTKDIKLESKQATGKTKLFPRTRPEKLLIVGFDNPITITQIDKNWKNNSNILEIDLLNFIKNSKRVNQLTNLTVKCLTCSESKSELSDELNKPLNVVGCISTTWLHRKSMSFKFINPLNVNGCIFVNLLKLKSIFSRLVKPTNMFSCNTWILFSLTKSRWIKLSYFDL